VLRAGNRCEYCRLAQKGQEAAFHIDHILPKVAGGRTGAANLALACVSCSLRKEARRSAIEPNPNRRVALFHPRRQRWQDHFRREGFRIVGLTPTGKTTVAALQMNRPLILAIRQEEAAHGRGSE
jgi:hypothetical protein